MADKVLSKTMISFRDDAHAFLKNRADELLEQEDEGIIAEQREGHGGKVIILKPEWHHKLEHAVGVCHCDALD